MKSLVCVFLLLLVLVEVMFCEGCWKQEREALIALSKSWVNKGTDCCAWEGIECNITTGRVTKLKLQYYPMVSLNYSDFAIFKDLKTLNLSYTDISNCTRTDQGLKNLEVLDLSSNEFDNAIGILSCVDGLSSLKSLSLADISFSVSFHDFQTVLETISSKLLHLEALDIGFNNLSNEILPSLRGFTSLKELHLNNIGLDSDLHFQAFCASLKNLEILDLSNNKKFYISGNNKFSDTDIASALSGLSSLKSLNLRRSKITPRSIHSLNNLEVLDLSGNSWHNAIGILSCLDGLSSLKSLSLALSETALPIFQTVLETISSKLVHLEVLDIGGNNLTNEILPSLMGFKSLKELHLSDIGLNSDLHFQENHGFGFAWPSSLQVLSLSDNGLSNNILSYLSGLPRLRSLDLSDNNLNGSLDISGEY